MFILTILAPILLFLVVLGVTALHSWLGVILYIVVSAACFIVGIYLLKHRLSIIADNECSPETRATLFALEIFERATPYRRKRTILSLAFDMAALCFFWPISISLLILLALSEIGRAYRTGVPYNEFAIRWRFRSSIGYFLFRQICPALLVMLLLYAYSLTNEFGYLAISIVIAASVVLARHAAMLVIDERSRYLGYLISNRPVVSIPAMILIDLMFSGFVFAVFSGSQDIPSLPTISEVGDNILSIISFRELLSAFPYTSFKDALSDFKLDDFRIWANAMQTSDWIGVMFGGAFYLNYGRFLKSISGLRLSDADLHYLAEHEAIWGNTQKAIKYLQQMTSIDPTTHRTRAVLSIRDRRIDDAYEGLLRYWSSREIRQPEILAFQELYGLLSIVPGSQSLRSEAFVMARNIGLTDEIVSTFLMIWFLRDLQKQEPAQKNKLSHELLGKIGSLTDAILLGITLGRPAALKLLGTIKASDAATRVALNVLFIAINAMDRGPDDAEHDASDELVTSVIQKARNDMAAAIDSTNQAGRLYLLFFHGMLLDSFCRAAELDSPWSTDIEQQLFEKITSREPSYHQRLKQMKSALIVIGKWKPSSK